jgi:hypothetical protein
MYISFAHFRDITVHSKSNTFAKLPAIAHTVHLAT